MAMPYQEGVGWSTRVRHKGHDRYLSGHGSARQARDAARDYSMACA